VNKSNLKKMDPRPAELAPPQRSKGERSEPGRSGGVANSGGASPATIPAPVPDPEVPAAAKRRRFTAEYKRSILDQVEACREEGAIGALLRREGLYSSHLSTWRRQRQQGELEGLTPNKRGRKPASDPLAEENRRLRAENARLTRQLHQAGTIIDVQKKVSTLLGISLPETPTEEENS
jgi:transposase-like protein